jgi:hypothetical protein
MRKICIIIMLAAIGTTTLISSASAQCKVEDIFNKYRSDPRCNSVSMSKEMLTVIAKQQELDSEDGIANISSVKILSVKVPRMSKINVGFISPDEIFDGNTTITTTSEGNMTITTAKEGKSNKEDFEKRVKEKQAQKAIEQKKKAEELAVFMQQLAKEAQSCIEASKYTELMSVNEDGKLVKYFSHQEGEKISEFIVVTGSSKEYSVIIIKGDDIKISSLSRLSGIIPSAKIDMDSYIN